MKISIKYVTLEVVKDRKCETLLFIDTESKKHCIDLAKTEGYKVLSTSKGVYTAEMDYLDATGENIFEEVATAVEASKVWDDASTQFTTFANKDDIAHLMTDPDAYLYKEGEPNV